MRLALYQPDIPQNLGAAIRLAACFGIDLDVIEPCGFPLTDRSLKRAALDYGALAKVTRHPSYADFQAQSGRAGARVILVETDGAAPLYEFEFSTGDTLLLGRESTGSPPELYATSAASVRIPMAAGARSLNVVVAGAMVLGEAMRQTGGVEEPVSETDDRKARAKAWFESLRDQLCAAFEALEDEAPPALYPGQPGRFVKTPWRRGDGSADQGGGVAGMMRGRFFEKVGVHVSTVHGNFSPEFAKQVRGAADNPRFWASGVSLIAHLKNPHCPAAHMNTRHIVTTVGWFGGGGDLNPTQAYQRQREFEDARDFRAAMKRACDAHGSDLYPRYEKWCDEYFWLPHRGEPRGVGGIFYDHHDSGNWDADFAFTQDVGKAFLDIYPALLRRHMATPWSDADREEQLIQRGRYAEFNLLYDRGTTFGLKTGGNVESILSSLPPVAKWP